MAATTTTTANSSKLNNGRNYRNINDYGANNGNGNNNNDNNSYTNNNGNNGNNRASASRRSSLSRPNSSNLAINDTVSMSRSATNGSNTSIDIMSLCQADDVERLNALIQLNGSAVASRRDQYGRTTLHYATEVGALRSSEVLLFHQPRLLQEQDIDGCTALHGAVIAGNLQAVRWLIQRGASAEAVDNEQHTVLHWATVSAHPEIVEYLLREVKVKPMPDLHHAYPLHYAAQMCGAESRELVESNGEIQVSSGTPGLSAQLALLTLLKLVECGHPLDVIDEDKRQPLIWAANNGAAEACYVLVSAGASVNAADKDGLTAAHCAATRGQPRCLAALLTECKAKHDSQDSNKCTPLFYAATFGHLTCCRVLIESGAHVNRIDRKRRTASHCAASKGHFDCLRYLLAVGADIWLRSAKGDYPISEAIANGHIGLVTQLLGTFTSEQRFALTKVRRGRTPLHSAAASNQLELCKVLIDFGSHVNALHYASSQYYSPYDFAVIKGNVEVADYLRARGAAPASKVVRQAARVVQKYFRAWNATKQQSNSSSIDDQPVQRPKSVSGNSERAIKLSPITQPKPIASNKEDPSQESLLTPFQASAVAVKKPRPTHKHGNRKSISPREMADDDLNESTNSRGHLQEDNNSNAGALFDASAGFFDEFDVASPKAKSTTHKSSPPSASRASSGSIKSRLALQKSASNSSYQQQQLLDSQLTVGDTATTQLQHVSAPVVASESLANYDDYPRDGVRIERPASSSMRSQAVSPSATVDSQQQLDEGRGAGVIHRERNESRQAEVDEHSYIGSGVIEAGVVRSSSRPVSGSIHHHRSRQGDNGEQADELEKILQRSTTSVGETLSIRDEDGDGVDSSAESDLIDNVVRSNESSGGDEIKLQSSGGGASLAFEQLTAATTNDSTGADEVVQPQPHAYGSRAQSSTKSVRIMETPIVLEPSTADAIDYDYDPQKKDHQRDQQQEQRQMWVDALGRAHQTPTTMKAARPLQRMKMKCSVVRVKSVSEQVHKNINQYERQRMLIEELKRLKRLQISKRNGVDQQYLTRSFSAIARKNNMISSTGGIDDAEKLLYDELYRRRLTEYRYIPEYHVEPSSEFAVYQVHNHRSPPVTTPATWSASSKHTMISNNGTVSGGVRATSAPTYETAGIRRHFEAATRRINNAMAERVEKAYVPQPHIQQLLDREEQMLSARSGTGLSSAGASPRVVGAVSSGLTSSNVSIHGETPRPHTSPGKIQNAHQQHNITSTTTVMSRVGFVKVQNGNSNYSASPRGRDNAVMPFSQSASQRQHPANAKHPQQQQSPLQRASVNHSPYMQPLLASLIESKSSKGSDSSSSRMNSSNAANLPEI